MDDYYRISILTYRKHAEYGSVYMASRHYRPGCIYCYETQQANRCPIPWK